MTTPIATITVPMPVDARLWLDLHKVAVDWHRRECHGIPEQPAPPKDTPTRRRPR